MVKGGLPFRVKPHPHPVCPNRRGKDMPVKGTHHGEGVPKDLLYGYLETYVRQEIQGCLQDLMEQEAQEFLGREKSASKAVADEQSGYRVDIPY